MAKKAKEGSPEQKLRALYDLQIIDSKIDNIRTVRGELPLEVQDLEDEITGLQTRVDKLSEEMDALNKEVAGKKNLIEEAKLAIKKYEEQQKNVRNNREFDSISKEIEFQTLEIQLAEKRIKEFRAKMTGKQEVLDESKVRVDERNGDLDIKNKELEEIIEETKKEEEILLKKSGEASKIVDERLFTAYSRIREASKNGLAVVPVHRGASGGSFIKIPPQRQLDIAARKKIIVDEHSGRILVDSDLAEEQTQKMNEMIEKLMAK
jgi:predicted  nucleic acid-binding Zn-ribbon protein